MLLARSFALVVVSFLAGCGASQAPGDDSAASEADLQKARGISLANGADIERTSGPESLRVIVRHAAATAKVTDASLATCDATKNASLSTTSTTVFDLSLDYDRDDGWNGCTFEFTAPGYKATVTAGFSIDD